MENTNGSQKNDDILEKFLSSKIKIKGKNKIQTFHGIGKNRQLQKQQLPKL